MTADADVHKVSDRLYDGNRERSHVRSFKVPLSFTEGAGMSFFERIVAEVREAFNPPREPSIGERIAAKSGGLRELELHLLKVRHDLPHDFGLFCALTPDGPELLALYQKFCRDVENPSFTAFAIAFLASKGVNVRESRP